MSIIQEAEKLRDYLLEVYSEEIRNHEMVDYSAFSKSIEDFEGIHYQTAKSEIMCLDEIFDEEMQSLFSIIKDDIAPVEVKRILMDAKK